MPKKPVAKKGPQSQKKSAKKKYKIRNWKAYNESLVQRGSLEFWIEQGVRVQVEITHEDGESKKKRGAPLKHSAEVIGFVLTLGTVFHQRLRQTEGLATSVVRMAGLQWKIPDFTTLSRRRKAALMRLTLQPKEHVIAVLDSTGLKVYGEGEWKVRKHGYSKHRTWTKVHISADRDGEIRVIKTTEHSVDDATVGVDMLQAETAHITDVSADGAYDKAKMYVVIQARGARALIPPRRDAKIWVHGNTKGDPHPRDENLRVIRRTSRKRWQVAVGYHRRSGAETVMFRLKMIFTDKLHARTLESQEREVFYRCNALNIMTAHGMPESYVIP